MTNIKYIQGNILKLKNYPHILIHSCNCDGSWGGGIAYQLSIRYPHAEREYVKLCENYGSDLLGKCALIPSYAEDNLIIACLFTSSFGGSSHGTKESIVNYTNEALYHMYNLMGESDAQKTYNAVAPLSEYILEMPQINSGIFGVPWEQTEAVLKNYKGKMDFTVYVL